MRFHSEIYKNFLLVSCIYVSSLRPSPGTTNNCEITFTPIIEMYAAKIQRMLGQEAMEVDEIENTMHVEQPSTSDCQPTPTVSTLYQSISRNPQSLEELIDQSKVQDSCSSNDQGLGNIMEGNLELEQAQTIFRKVFGTKIPMDDEYDWTSRNNFKVPCTNGL